MHACACATKGKEKINGNVCVTDGKEKHIKYNETPAPSKGKRKKKERKHLCHQRGRKTERKEKQTPVPNGYEQEIQIRTQRPRHQRGEKKKDQKRQHPCHERKWEIEKTKGNTSTIKGQHLYRQRVRKQKQTKNTTPVPPTGKKKETQRTHLCHIRRSKNAIIGQEKENTEAPVP